MKVAQLQIPRILHSPVILWRESSSKNCARHSDNGAYHGSEMLVLPFPLSMQGVLGKGKSAKKNSTI